MRHIADVNLIAEYLRWHARSCSSDIRVCARNWIVGSLSAPHVRSARALFPGCLGHDNEIFSEADMKRLTSLMVCCDQYP